MTNTVIEAGHLLLPEDVQETTEVVIPKKDVGQLQAQKMMTLVGSAPLRLCIGFILQVDGRQISGLRSARLAQEAVCPSQIILAL